MSNLSKLKKAQKNADKSKKTRVGFFGGKNNGSLDAAERHGCPIDGHPQTLVLRAVTEGKDDIMTYRTLKDHEKLEEMAGSSIPHKVQPCIPTDKGVARVATPKDIVEFLGDSLPGFIEWLREETELATKESSGEVVIKIESGNGDESRSHGRAALIEGRTYDDVKLEILKDLVDGVRDEIKLSKEEKRRLKYRRKNGINLDDTKKPEEYVDLIGAALRSHLGVDTKQPATSGNQDFDDAVEKRVKELAALGRVPSHKQFAQFPPVPIGFNPSGMLTQLAKNAGYADFADFAANFASFLGTLEPMCRLYNQYRKEAK